MENCSHLWEVAARFFAILPDRVRRSNSSIPTLIVFITRFVEMVLTNQNTESAWCG